MKNIASLSKEDRLVLFTQTASKMAMHPSIVEKDFWVCYMLDHLFHDCKYKDIFVFKGGTSLSKSYHIIERFSEDIDLIIDWRKLIPEDSDPWEERSKTKQDKYNKQINKAAAEFYISELVPILNEEISLKLGEGKWLSVNEFDEMVIDFFYPRDFETEYIVPVVRLEIGPLAEWMPSHQTKITPFVAEKYPQIFQKKNTEILTVDVERTFWEKITILHKIANFPENKSLPRRYARHLYDVYCLGNSNVKQKAFDRKELLEKDIEFKQKFYYSKGAHYDTATIQTVSLTPAEHIMTAVHNDYDDMRNMIYGEYPKFEDILQTLSKLEEEIHNL